MPLSPPVLHPGYALKRPSWGRATALVAASLTLLAGCATLDERQPLDISQPGWRVSEGQATWVPGHAQMPLTGELLLANGPGESLCVQFSKPPFTLVSGQAAGESWRIEYPLQRKASAGRQPPPLDLVWFALPRALASQGKPIPGWDFRRKAGGEWSLMNGRTGEQLEGFLNP